MAKLFANGAVSIRGETFTVDRLEYQTRLVETIGTPTLLRPLILPFILAIILFLIGLFGISTVKAIWLILGIIMCCSSGFLLYKRAKRLRKPKYKVDLVLKPDKRSVAVIFGDEKATIEFCLIIEEQQRMAEKAFEES